jgi:hypothetical protein
MAAGAPLARWHAARRGRGDDRRLLFRNPKEYRGDCGFEEGADLRIVAMLGFVDVNEPRYGKGNLGARPLPAQPA